MDRSELTQYAPDAKRPSPEDVPSAELALRRHLAAVGRYRRVIGAAMGAVAILFFVAALGLWLTAPVERVGSVQFRLLFEGAADNKYPNGIPFGPAEIIAPPVLREVYRINDLQQYGSYDYFKEAIFIQQRNPQLDALTAEYSAKLSDLRLSPVDRARIEAEFKNRRDSLRDPSFGLSLRRTERLKVLPRDVAEKTLNDTLSIWAQQADVVKGALRYSVPMLSVNILSRDTLDKEDYLIAADLLRAKAQRIISTIDELEKQPGAMTVRTKSGVSIAEVRTALEDTIRFSLEPLLGLVRSEGITKNARFLSLYATNQVFQLRLDKEEALGRAKALEESLRAYQQRNPGPPAVTAEGRTPASDVPALTFGEAFLDRLVQMSTESQAAEMAYRQRLTDALLRENTRVATFNKELEYYEDLSRSLSGSRDRGAGSPELIGMISQRSTQAFDAISKATNELGDLYKELSAHNLNPAARLYVITAPYAERAQRGISSRTLALVFAFVMLLTFVVAAILCAVYEAVREPTLKVRPTPAARV